MARLRIFLALELDDAVRQNVVVLQRALGQKALSVKWVEPQNLHLTLLFLGDVEDRELHGLFRVVTRVAARHEPIALRLGGVGAFPTPRRPKTVWAGVTGGVAELQRLYADLEVPLQELGCYRREERAYTPHLTLGRAGGDEDSEALALELPAHAAWNGGLVNVEELVIFSSELRRAGPEHSVVGRAPFSAE